MDLGRFGRAIRALRFRRGWRQEDLAVAAGVSRSQVGRMERGESGKLPVDALDRVTAALGAHAELRVLWHGEGLDRLLDEAHARLVDWVVRRLQALGWEVAVEVSFARNGERGSIDVLAFHPGRRALLVIEVKSVTPDMQAMLGGLDRKGRLGPAIARERGWDPATVAQVLVLGDTRTNRRRLEVHAATIRAALPAGTREITRWVADPVAPPPAGVWLQCQMSGEWTATRSGGTGCELGESDRAWADHPIPALAHPAGTSQNRPDDGPPGGHLARSMAIRFATVHLASS